MKKSDIFNRLKKDKRVLAVIGIGILGMLLLLMSETKASEKQTETSAAAAAAASDNGDFPAGDVYVILNTKTKCIHLDPGCQHAKKISDENREETYSDIAALADEGYWACSKCAGDYRDIAPKP